jgi:hypothetical protein
MKMTTAMIVKMLEKLQHVKWHIPKGLSYVIFGVLHASLPQRIQT